MLRPRLFPVLVMGAIAAAAILSSEARAQGVKLLPTSVTAVVDTSGDLSVACVETEPGGDVRGGWWDSGNPGSVDLCDLLAGGTYLDPNACNSNDGQTIVGRGDVGPGGGSFNQVPVLCRAGSTTQLTYTVGLNEGKAQCVSANGTRIWGGLFAGGRWYPFLWRDDNTLAWNSNTDAWWLGNFFSITQFEILDCSDDGQVCCGWYEWMGDGNRWPFVIDLDSVSNFEDCFGGATQLHQGEARCVSRDGSKVFVYRLDNDRTYECNPADPSATAAFVANGQPLYCNENGSRVVGYEVDGGVDVGWIWKQGSGRSDLATVPAYDGLRPSCFDRTGKHVGGVLQNGVDVGGLWRDNKFDGFSALLAARDSLNKPYPNYEFSDVVAISQDGRTFYCDGESSGTDRWFYVELSPNKQFVWKEKGRGYPPFITEYCYYAYYYALLAASAGNNQYYSLSQVYGEAAYNLDAPCRQVKYDYWQGKDARKNYKNLRNQQYLYEYYCYYFAYYGQFSGGASQYGPYAQIYADYASQFILGDLSQ